MSKWKNSGKRWHSTSFFVVRLVQNFASPEADGFTEILEFLDHIVSRKLVRDRDRYIGCLHSHSRPQYHLPSGNPVGGVSPGVDQALGDGDIQSFSDDVARRARAERCPGEERRQCFGCVGTLAHLVPGVGILPPSLQLTGPILGHCLTVLVRFLGRFWLAQCKGD